MNNSKRQYEQHINTKTYNKITFYTLSNDILLRKTTYTYGALTGKSSYEINGETIKEYLENLFSNFILLIYLYLINCYFLKLFLLPLYHLFFSYFHILNKFHI